MNTSVNVKQIQDDRFVVAVLEFGEYNISMKAEDYSDLGADWITVLSSLFNVLADNEELESLPKEFDAPYYLNKYEDALKRELEKEVRK